MEKKAKGVIYRVRVHKLNRIAVSLEVSFTLYLNHSRERGARIAERWHTRGRAKVFVRRAPPRGHPRTQINDPVWRLKRVIRFENNLGRKMRKDNNRYTRAVDTVDTTRVSLPSVR